MVFKILLLGKIDMIEKAKILIVEDESLVALDIKTSSEEYDYTVIGIAKDCATTLVKLRELTPDLILMDINLKKSIDGIETVIHIQEKYNIPVIYLTAYTDETTIQRAIKTDPLGYIVKPFKPEELNATIKLALYKIHTSTDNLEKDDVIDLKNGYCYSFKIKQLYFKDHPIKLSKNENMLLELLIEAKDNSVSYREIEYYIWPDSVVNNDTLRALVYRLRTKLNFLSIETIPSYGYKLKT